MKILTSESVNIGHPDKTCDVIADCFLDAALKEDENSQMAVECAIKNNKLFIYGEATTKAKINYDEIAKRVLNYVGYDAENFEIIKELSHQSPDINSAVVKNTEIAANDQGIIFGYACSETENYMPKPFEIANKLMMEYENFRLKNKNFFADAKSQVSVEYENDKPVRVNTILLSVSHSEELTLEEVENFTSLTGRGLQADLAGKTVYVGNRRLMEELQVDLTASETAVLAATQKGQTPIYISANEQLIGVITVADLLKADSKDTVAKLQNQGIDVVLLTGDNSNTAQAIAKQAGIKTVISEVLPLCAILILSGNFPSQRVARLSR